ncbi:MAG: hypothetical protein P8048_10610 [Calditrichia bacterium]|jgi:hypothetical protein
MKKYLVSLFVCLCLGLISSSFTQAIDKNIDLILTLGADKVHFQHGDVCVYGGAVALEYHKNHLYFATPDQLFVLDLNGNVIGQANLEGKAIFLYDPIKDICYLDSMIYLLNSKNELLLINDNRIASRYKLYFQKVTEADIKDRDPVNQAFQPEYLENVENKLYFYNRIVFFPFNKLVPMKTESIPSRLEVDKVFTNANMNWSIAGRPISDCDAIKNISNLKRFPNLFDIKIAKYCRNTSEIKRVQFNYKNKIRYLNGQAFFKNNYLGTYFVPAMVMQDGGKNSIIFLDENFNLQKVVENIPYHGGEYSAISPDIQSSFTCDEKGNVYYCTNKYNCEEVDSSKVEFYRINY